MQADKEQHLTFRNIPIERVKLINNRVLLKRKTFNAKGKTRGGIYYPEECHENQRLYQNADVVYEVIRIPEKLTDAGGRWMTDIEIQVGDIVWVKHMSSLSAPVIFDDKDNEYRLIEYFDLVVAKRVNRERHLNNTTSKYLVEDDIVYEVIPLNGYILVEDIYVDYKEKTALKKRVKDPLRGRVKYVGNPNKYYVYSKKKHMDLDRGVEIKQGDIISPELYQMNKSIENRKYLEEDMFAKFDGDKKYFYLQRPDINGIFRN